MYNELKEDMLLEKVGGRFKLATLMQKRIVALMYGARPLVDLKTNDYKAIVIQEILENKIYLDYEGRVRTVEDEQEPRDGGEVDLTS